MIRFRWTLSDRYSRRGMWLWDTCFSALSYLYVDVKIAAEVLRALLSMQRDDGFIPPMASLEEFYADNIQPPLVAWASWEV